ncbi:MAG: hypothetical protein Q8P32_04345 [Candidatus Komeilibacteria bacterium]|nr:hypothetical protein [Candidatus Komeilibacteria bacterium]
MNKAEKKKKQANQINLWLNKNHKPIVGSVFILVLAVGLFWLVFPKYQGLREVATGSLPDKIGELQALEDYAVKIKQLEKVIADWQVKNQAKVAILEQVLPDTPRVPELIAQLDALARSNGFIINSVDFTESEAPVSGADSRSAAKAKAGSQPEVQANLNLDKNIRLVSINLNLTGGDYSAFKKFLDALEKNMRLLDVLSIDFSSTLSAGTDYTLALMTYYLISPATQN